MAQPLPKLQRAVRDWPFKVKPLHPVLGCEITGITLAEAVSPAMFAKIYEAFLDYELILFRDVDLPPATQVAFARNFGEVQIHVLSQYHGYKDHPEIYMASKFVGVRFSQALRAACPIYAVFLITIAFAIYFPSVVLWLPKQVLPASVGCFPNPDGTGYICPP